MLICILTGHWKMEAFFKLHLLQSFQGKSFYWENSWYLAPSSLPHLQFHPYHLQCFSISNSDHLLTSPLSRHLSSDSPLTSLRHSHLCCFSCLVNLKIPHSLNLFPSPSPITEVRRGLIQVWQAENMAASIGGQEKKKVKNFPSPLVFEARHCAQER